MGKEQEKEISHIIDEMTENGEVMIPEEVFGTIAGIAALETDGVYALTGGITKDKLSKVSPRAIAGTVKVETCDRSATVYLSVETEYGFNLPDVNEALTNRVKSAIENMTDFLVEKVNICITGIHVDAERP